MHRLYSISFNWGAGLPFTALVDNTLTRPGDDWVRFSEQQWYYWSASSVAEVTDRMRSCISVGPQQCIVAELKPTMANGAAPDWLWDWLNKRMTEQLDQVFKSGSS